MINKLFFVVLSILLTLSSALAAEKPYDQSTFNNLLSHNEPVVIHVHASWCPVCRAQQEILDEILPTADFAKLTVLKADFDTEKALLRKYKVRNQSTFLVFRHGKEVDRSTGDTDRDSIFRLLKEAF